MILISKRYAGKICCGSGHNPAKIILDNNEKEY
jgi:hypothetical protein